MEVKNFEDLEIWKDARLLIKGVYRMTKETAFAKDFGLRDQIRRASVSVMSNIAEGFERGGNQEFIQFLYVAQASCGEVRSQLYVALDQSYITQRDCDDAIQSFHRLSVMNANLIDYLKRSNLKEAKYTESYKSKNSKPLIRSDTF